MDSSYFNIVSLLLIFRNHITEIIKCSKWHVYYAPILNTPSIGDEIDYGQEPVQNRNFTENLIFKSIKLENQLIEKYFQKMANIVNKKIEYVLRT